MSRGDSFNNFLRSHDQCLYDWLGGLEVDYGTVQGQPFPAKSILRVYATPMKAFATMAQVLIRKGWIPIPTGTGGAPLDPVRDMEEIERVVPLPFCSIYREPPVHDPARDNPSFIFRSLGRDANGDAIGHKHPTPYKISYQLDFWCLKKYTEAHIYEWVISQISGSSGASRNEMFIPIQHGGVHGLKKQALRLTGFSDNSELEPDVKARRWLRFTAQLELNALFFHTALPPKKVIMSVQQEVRNDTLVDENNLQEAPILEGNSFLANLFLPAAAVQTNVTEELAPITSDGRVQKEKFYIPEGDINRKLTFSAAGEWTKTLMYPNIPVTEAVASITTFSYLFQTTETSDATLSILRGTTVIQKFNLAKTDKWKKLSIALYRTDKLTFKFEMSGAGTIYLDLLKDHGKRVIVAENVAFGAPAVEGSTKVYRASGLDDDEIYVVFGSVLDISVPYSIIVTNAEVGPNVTEEQIVDASIQAEYATALTPKHGQDALKVTLGNTSAAISDLVAVKL